VHAAILHAIPRHVVCPGAVGALLLSVLVAVGCKTGDGSLLGYRHKPLYDPNLGTVAVDIFDNQTFEKGVEFDVTEALVKEIELRTPYKVVDRSLARTLLTGSVVDVRRGVLNREFEAGVPQEMQVRITVSFEWKDRQTGRMLRKRNRITGTGEFIPTRPVSEPFEVGQHTAVAELARDIVSVMQDDW